MPARPCHAHGNRDRGIPRRDACGYDGQAATRLAHIPRGATAATGRAIQGNPGGLRNNRNTPWPSRQVVRKGEATSEIEHRTTKVRRPQSNGFVERLHCTLLDEHFRIMGRKTFYESIDAMQKDLDAYLVRYNAERPHQGHGMKGKTPADAFVRYLPKPKTPKEDKMKQAA